MCVSVFLNYICAAHACLMPLDVRQKCQALGNVSDNWVGAAIWMLGTEPRSLKEQSVLLTTKLPPQALMVAFVTMFTLVFSNREAKKTWPVV